MLSADRSGAPRVQADILRLPVPDSRSTASRAGSRSAIWPTCRRSSPNWRGWCDRAGGSRLLDVSTPPNPVIRTGNNIYFGHVVPRIGAALSDGPAYRYLPKSVAYLPSPDEMVAMLAAAGFAAVRHTQLSGGLTQLLVATRSVSVRLRDMYAITRSRRRGARRGNRGQARPERHRPRRRHALRARRRRGSPGRGAAARVAADAASDRLAGCEHDSTVESHGPIAIGVVPFRPGTACDLLVPEVVVRKSGREPDHDHRGGVRPRRMPTDSSPTRSRGSARTSPRTRRRRPPDASRSIRGADRAVSRRGGDGPRLGPRGRSRQGGDRSADHRQLRPADRRPRGPAPPPRQLRVELPLLDRRSDRRLTRTAHRGRRRHRPIAPPRRDRSAHRRRHERRRARRRAHRQHQEPDRASGRDRRRPRHAAAVVELPRLGARTLDRDRRQRAAPRNPHGGPALAARPVGDRAGAGAVADPRARRRSPRRGGGADRAGGGFRPWTLRRRRRLGRRPGERHVGRGHSLRRTLRRSPVRRGW